MDPISVDIIVRTIQGVGFPIAVAAYVLVRLDRSLTQLREELTRLREELKSYREE